MKKDVVTAEDEERRREQEMKEVDSILEEALGKSDKTHIAEGIKVM